VTSSARPSSESLIVLYDADCGFCRWAMAWALRHDRRHQLVAAPIQSPLGAELLGDLAPDRRLAAVHTVGADGHRRSGGAAAAEVLDRLDGTRLLGRLAHSTPGMTGRLYNAVARRRTAFGRFVGGGARRRADRVLDRARVTTSAELESRAPGRAPVTR
jgi:predicted DCC family thiol-disulfide oxidoreductase YuxK